MSLWIEDIVQKNKYSRPDIKLVGVRGIVLHYTANNGGTAKNHADYFDGSDGGGGRYAGAHLFVDKNEARLIIPLDEAAYHANDKPSKVASLRETKDGYSGNANLTTIGIEMCVEKDGSIHQNTIDRTMKIIVHLCKVFRLSANDIYRHYDITGKVCPKPFVDNPKLFTSFKQSVDKLLNPPKPKKKEVPVKKSTSPLTRKTVSGDTFWGLANEYGIEVEQLQSYNPEIDPLALPIGITLKLTPLRGKVYTSIVDYLKDHNLRYDFVSRRKLAEKYGINNYSGTADQNIELLRKIQE